MIRKLLPFFFLTLIISCGQGGNHFQLKGKFKNINQGNFYIYDMERGVKDTISLRDGQFTYDMELSDTTLLTLLFPNYSELPIIAIPGSRVKIDGDVSHLKGTHVSGTDDNELLTDFRMQTNDKMPPQVVEMAEKMINEHPESPVSLYLLQKYFIQTADADYQHVYELFTKLLEARPGNITLIQMNQRLAAVSKLKNNGKLPAFKAKDINGETVTDSLLNKQANVILVWASWNYDSHAALRHVSKLVKEHPDSIAVVSIRMDASKHDGRNVLERDSIKWPDICDGNVWESPLVDSLCIAYVPDNIVVDKKGNIVGRTLSTNDLKEKVLSLLK